MIGIVDYSAGNIKSVLKAFDHIGVKSRLVTSSSDFKGIDRLVLPGVGSFGHAVKQLGEKNLFRRIRMWLNDGRPFLGICLGLQLLYSGSEESGVEKGFAFFEGQCRIFQKGKVPQIGWNSIKIEKDSPLFNGIESGTYFYFVHSYYAPCLNKRDVLGSTNYFEKYTSIAGRGSVFAVQFHPEKSGEEGIKLLRNWVSIC